MDESPARLQQCIGEKGPIHSNKLKLNIEPRSYLRRMPSLPRLLQI